MLELRSDDSPRFLVQSFICPVRVQNFQFSSNSVMLSEPQCVYGREARLLAGSSVSRVETQARGRLAFGVVVELGQKGPPSARRWPRHVHAPPGEVPQSARLAHVGSVQERSVQVGRQLVQLLAVAQSQLAGSGTGHGDARGLAVSGVHGGVERVVRGDRNGETQRVDSRGRITRPAVQDPVTDVGCNTFSMACLFCSKSTYSQKSNPFVLSWRKKQLDTDKKVNNINILGIRASTPNDVCKKS